jgi:hypothetical protein
MSKRTVMFSLAMIVAMAAITGCSKRIGDFTMVTTKNYERQVSYKMVGRMEGSDNKLIILGIPLGSPDLKEAVDRAIQAGSGVYLANAVIEQSGWFAILIGSTGYTVTGDVYAAADRGDLLNPDIEKFQLKEGTDGQLSMVSVNDEREVAVQDISDMVTQ